MASLKTPVQSLLLFLTGEKPTIPSPVTAMPGDTEFNVDKDVMVAQLAYNIVDDIWFYRSAYDEILQLGVVKGTSENPTDINIYPWALEETKPSYFYTEVGAAAADHGDHGLAVHISKSDDHPRDERNEEAFTKNTAFNKSFGTTAGTVLEGNSFGNYVTINGDQTITGVKTFGANILPLANIGSTIGEYNMILSPGFGGTNTSININNVVGENIGTASIGNYIKANMITGKGIFNVAESTFYSNIICGADIGESLKGYILNNIIVGSDIAEDATLNMDSNFILGSYFAKGITGTINNCFSLGSYNIHGASNVTNIVGVVAIGGSVFKDSTTSDLDNAIGIGSEAGHGNAYTNPALFGIQSNATADKQVVIGSSYYTGGILLDNDVTANSFIKVGGLSTEFLKADGSVDSGSPFLSSGSWTIKEVGTSLEFYYSGVKHGALSSTGTFTALNFQLDDTF